MKKFFALILVLAMVAIISVPALADGVVLHDNTTGNYTPTGKIYVNNVEVGNIFDNRVTVTCGEILFPGVGAGNYTEYQLGVIAKTWVEFKLEPNGMLPMVFGGGLEINGKTYNAGVAAYVGGKTQTIKIRNGELVFWDLLEDMHADIKNRMAAQIDDGNADINYELAFKACSTEIAGYFPTELLKNNDVEIIDVTITD